MEIRLGSNHFGPPTKNDAKRQKSHILYSLVTGPNVNNVQRCYMHKS